MDERRATDAVDIDVLIVGAGLSGIGAAWHLKARLPHLRVRLIERRNQIGGTWDLFRYPGVRSDSDMHTLAYRFRPWTGKEAIAQGDDIRSYIRDTAAEAGIDRDIRFGHTVRSANWSSQRQCWEVVAEEIATGQTLNVSARYLWMCSGYYRYEQAHWPRFEGEQAFEGRIVHPQFWPEDLEWEGKRVVVIGSGATAITLVPALAEKAAKVTMLQRSPSYIFSRPAIDPVATALSSWLPQRTAYRAVRAKNIVQSAVLYWLARRYPKRIKQRLTDLVREQLPDHFDVDRHFTPVYNPWDQRICVATDGDLFKAIAQGRVEVVTDEIDRVTPRGLRTKGGLELNADIVVVATGLQLNVLGDMQLSVEGRKVVPSQQLVYRGAMLSGVPNLFFTFGYTNASWTLKADLIARFACRLIKRMERHQLASATPVVHGTVKPEAFMDFTSGYVTRARSILPKQGDRGPWRVHQNYFLDWFALRLARRKDGALTFTARSESAAIKGNRS